MKLIKNSPGPCEYDTINQKENAVSKPTFNFKLKMGGIPVPRSGSEDKDDLMAKTFLKQGSPKTSKVNWTNQSAQNVIK